MAAVPRLVPPRVAPPPQPLRGLAFFAGFIRNPIGVVPQAAYEGDLVAYARGRREIVWITAPDMIRQVLLDEREKFLKLAQIRLLSPLLGKGMLTSEGADWKWQRQAAAPMFRQQDLMGFVPAFVRAADTANRSSCPARAPCRCEAGRRVGACRSSPERPWRRCTGRSSGSRLCASRACRRCGRTRHPWSPR